jgi:alpha-ketoglutarate-dependent taurine dioxygenase
MRIIDPTPFISIEDIKNNVEHYSNMIIDNKIVCFRDANLSVEDQSLVREIFGDYFNWYPQTSDRHRKTSDTNKIKEMYQENHSRLTSNKSNSDKDEIILPWHVEHTEYNIPIVASFWNMIKFSADPETGKTLFVDTSEIYDNLSDDWKNFLNKSKYCSSKTNYPNFVKPAVSKHWWIDKKVIRLDLTHYNGDIDYLYEFDGREPTDSEKEKFTKIREHILNLITINNEDFLYVHKWKEGDLLVSDLFVLAHSITGGFNSEDREFVGLWARDYYDIDKDGFQWQHSGLKNNEA